MATAHLLMIPAELRNEIYAYALTVNVDLSNKQLKSPGIILACKQTYGETLKLHYQHTTFVIHSQRVHRAVRHITNMPKACRNPFRLQVVVDMDDVEEQMRKHPCVYRLRDFQRNLDYISAWATAHVTRRLEAVSLRRAFELKVDAKDLRMKVEPVGRMLAKTPLWHLEM